ncbi:hypothetical protein EDD18DRAFT_1367111 [Armillaria luteobubalina]|uniref:Uncharacterized protein n=1 Tax=Armillaria luteobubalina TaxID=153913 RepID=A0AA39P1B9_9AGAR|nr:hypothetical protein EDD18DRAFT_1367111 [Armillaria luteobubalina]
MASPSPTSPSPVAPVAVSPTAPLVASSIAPVILPMALPSSSQGAPWVPPPMDPFGSNSLNLALTPFNGLANDLDFFLVGLQQGLPEHPHVPPLPPLPPPHDDSSNMMAEILEVRASKHTCKPHTHREVVVTGWMPPAVGYLSDATLGSEWQNLLVSWQDLKARLQAQGCSPGKGHMGALSSRPSVLSHWLINHHYNVYPHPPAHFSDKLCKWWNAMQPHWHQNQTGMLPLLVYDRLMDKTLQKGGPNGIVTILGTLDGNGN